MTIDHRLLITPAAPFGLLLFARVFFWVAGTPLDDDARFGFALFSLIAGTVVGGGTTMLCFLEGIDLGRTRIGRSKDAAE